MGHPFHIKTGDRLPSFSGAPKNADGDLVDLSAVASTIFNMRGSGAGTYCLRDTATITDTVALGLTPANASAVRLAYHWATVFATAGYFEGELEVTFASGKVQTFPNQGYSPITAASQIGP